MAGKGLLLLLEVGVPFVATVEEDRRLLLVVVVVLLLLLDNVGVDSASLPFF